MSQPNPSYADGLQGVTTLSAYCYNNNRTYICYDGDPGTDAAQKQWTDSNEEPLGSDTRTGFRSGTLNLQYTLAVDELPGDVDELKTGFIILFRNRYYVAGAVKPKVVKNEVIKFSVAVLELQNPFIPNLLSVLGQQLKASINANANTTVNCVALGARTNGVVTYSVETFATQGSSAPAGVTINANTGLMTVNIVAGTVDVRVLATDTLTGEITDVGFGRYTPTAA